MAQEVGNGRVDGVRPEDLDRCLEIYVSHFDARNKFRMQYRLRREDGRYRWIDDIGTPRYGRDVERRIRETTMRLESEIAVRSQTKQELLHSSGTALGSSPS
jgi:PAS domain-containing protein